MSTPAIDLNTVEQLTAGRIGTFDVPCPSCGPWRRSPFNQRRRVFRIWRVDQGFASFHCARCGERGFVRDEQATQPDPVVLALLRAEAAKRELAASAERLSKARWLWSQRRPIGGSIAETYLRAARGYSGLLPATLAFLPARGEYPPAMIAAFGIPEESEPGEFSIRDDAVQGVHLTRLRPDGCGKAGGEADKIMVGHSAGWPLVLAPPNDLLGLTITEGIEDALSVHEATGLGAWAAGSASRMPALADAIPSYIEAVTIVADDDADGRRHANELGGKIRSHGNIDVRILTPIMRRAA